MPLYQPKCNNRLCNQSNDLRLTKSLSTPSKSMLNHELIDLFSSSKEKRDRSQSPITDLAPWRLNRRRVKKPMYPRLINDPVKARKAVLRLSDENLRTGKFCQMINF